MEQAVKQGSTTALPRRPLNQSIGIRPRCPVAGREFRDPATRRFHVPGDSYGTPSASPIGVPVDRAPDPLRRGRSVMDRGPGQGSLAAPAFEVRRLRPHEAATEDDLAAQFRFPRLVSGETVRDLHRVGCPAPRAWREGGCSHHESIMPPSCDSLGVAPCFPAVLRQVGVSATDWPSVRGVGRTTKRKAFCLADPLAAWKSDAHLPLRPGGGTSRQRRSQQIG